MTRLDDIRSRRKKPVEMEEVKEPRKRGELSREARLKKYKAQPEDFADDPEELERIMREKGGTPEQLFGEILPPDDHVNFSTSAIGSGMSRPVVENGVHDSMSLITEEKQESDTAKAIIAIMGDDDLRKQSELSKEEVRALTVLSEISDKFNSPRLRTLLENWLAHMVSHDRGSRREVVEAFSGLEEHGRGQRGGMYAPPGTMPLRLQ